MKKITQLLTMLSTIILLVLTAQAGFSQVTYDTPQTNTVITIPAGATHITVEAWGGGGRGGTRTTNTRGGGGGGGGYSRSVISVTPGTNYRFTVGAGSNSTSAGGTSLFETSGGTDLVVAYGGNSCGNSATGATGAALGVGDVRYTGGAGATAPNDRSGGGGSSAGIAANGVAASGVNGGVAPADGGNGANGVNNGNTGVAGQSPGGGGSGCYRNSTATQYGGAGANGQIRITYHYVEIGVSGNGVNIIAGDATPNTTDHTNFGNADVVTGYVDRTFTITNSGSAPLTIGGVTITGTNASDYSVLSAPPATVAPGIPETFVIRFDPSTTGARYATINISNNDPNENPFTFAIQGNGTSPEINVRGNGSTISTGDSTPSTADHTDFGSMRVSGGSIDRVFTIQNTGAYPLNVSGVSITGPDASSFTIVSSPAAVVAASGSTTFTVRFDPVASGTLNATVSIDNNDSNENPYTFAIRGTGTDPEIDVQGNLISIPNGDTTTSLSNNTDFGSVSIDAGTASVYYTVHNTGVGPLVLSGLSIIGPDAAHFTIISGLPGSVAQGASATFEIGFSPTTLGYKNATIVITNDDDNENPYTYAIRGLGVRTYPDTDGDNISDNIDIDDDNDGIIDVLEQIACTQSGVASTVESIFLNETFGAGPTRGMININIPGASCTYCYEDGIVGPNYGACTYQYLSTLNDGEYVVINSIADHGWSAPEDHTPDDNYGRMAVFNASYDPGTFYETSITGIIPNVPINYSFWVLNVMPQSNYPGSILPNITVEFLDLSNNVISTYNTGDIGRCGDASTPTSTNTCAVSEWRQYSTSVNLGSVTTFKIRFKNNAPGGGGNDLALDDIVIRQQYCDRDGDGIADIFDLDSDNDGIPDVEEAGFKNLTVGRGMINLASGWVDANGNGLHDSIDTMIANSTYAIPDTDGDGIRDYLDLDSDNDSWFDIDEAGIYNGDGDVNGDGAGDGVDTDRDGILDLHDTYEGRGTDTRPFAQNTDGIGNPDYISVDSDNDGTFDIATSIYYALDTNNDGRIDGNTDADKDGLWDNFDTNTSFFGSPRDLTQKLHMEFDGRNDYGQANGVLSNLSQATIMAWIKFPADATSSGFVIGQENFNLKVTNSSGYQLAYSGKGISGVCPTALQPNRWYHIALVHNGNATSTNPKTMVYINGVLEASSNAAASAGALPTNTSKFMFGSNNTGGEFFKGSIDEVRLFNRPLAADQIQKMMYQEINAQGTAIRGTVIPKNVDGGVWSSLLAYYRMDTYKDDVIDDFVTATVDQGSSTSLARIYNVKKLGLQTAPMPFVTSQPGNLDAAVSQNNYVNPSDIYDYDWSIVRINHNVTVPVNDTSLGMIVDAAATVVANNDNLIANSWYLELNGVLDLQGRSQLLQTAASDLAVTSAGRIERDQQGTVNKFNYNYWASPVGAINTATNNTAFTVGNVMKDGTDPNNPQNIQWTTGLNGSATSPITLSSYWVFKFQNVSNDYANWSSVGNTGSLLPGMGFTLKGSSALTATQNYVFTGKPNNANITLPISGANLNLCGNPYPSALDANQFITDNLSSITGALYFWEHYDTNTSHNLLQYQGGYATYTMVGGTPPVSPAGISGLGTSTRVPGRYIPVGQGFFVEGDANGGTILFRNAQRAFRIETDTQSNVMFRGNTEGTTASVNNQEEPDTYKRIRLGFNSYNNYHRQILLGFMEQNATPGFDPGYDGIHFDDQPNDMYFVQNGMFLNIQGDGYFNETLVYPLGVKAYLAGTVQFTLDAIENFDADQPVYIHDNVTGLYHNIRTEPFTIALSNGTINNRFSLRFQATSLSNNEVDAIQNGINVVHTQNDSMLTIRNTTDALIEGVMLYNMLGQEISKWEISDSSEELIRIPVVNLADGAYIVKIKTDKGDISKKIATK